jgi:hypothetical protein
MPSLRNILGSIFNAPAIFVIPKYKPLPPRGDMHDYFAPDRRSSKIKQRGYSSSFGSHNAVNSKICKSSIHSRMQKVVM